MFSALSLPTSTHLGMFNDNSIISVCRDAGDGDGGGGRELNQFLVVVDNVRSFDMDTNYS
uniref:Uncharacterized protein n=1 Tax=Glossina brevipalpis TaxID=37001 RepID=A0A1A9WHS8_9MUSC